jgi:DNA polymerase alpha subunit B
LPSHFPVEDATYELSQVVESVLVVNPGYLSKRRAAGSYAKLTIKPYSLTDEERASKTMIGHKLFERARVDILKI